ncbi:hypothetical protein LEP1GSC058_4057 [Leptospira fainei serovar Hurstbridge str. BUT 6]|uniref:Uncharacterized protein n=1 Tax=Leptospira fainei serovar Hurstbridge str. BUT 6 TaxID=1193011 RepID=S3VBQ5_9LEPT|nr:hypothetical protein LEP1GSC058_4057 [Leptospira fainei serovar Hurstbridge str. BUT 6]
MNNLCSREFFLGSPTRKKIKFKNLCFKVLASGSDREKDSYIRIKTNRRKQFFIPSFLN